MLNNGVVRDLAGPNYSNVWKDISMNIYYVYAYLRTDGTPYYIGKGKGDRAWKKHHRSNGTNLVPKDITKIQIVAEGLSESDAYRMETQLISHHGRKDLGTGILRNRANGGEGRTGPLTYSLESKKIRTEKMSGDKNPSKRPEVRAAKHKFMIEFWEKHPEKKQNSKDRMSTVENPNNIRLTCVFCKKETTLPIFRRDHKHEK